MKINLLTLVAFLTLSPLRAGELMSMPDMSPGVEGTPSAKVFVPLKLVFVGPKEAPANNRYIRIQSNCATPTDGDYKTGKSVGDKERVVVEFTNVSVDNCPALIFLSNYNTEKKITDYDIAQRINLPKLNVDEMLPEVTITSKYYQRYVPK